MSLISPHIPGLPVPLAILHVNEPIHHSSLCSSALPSLPSSYTIKSPRFTTYITTYLTSISRVRLLTAIRKLALHLSPLRVIRPAWGGLLVTVINGDSLPPRSSPTCSQPLSQAPRACLLEEAVVSGKRARHASLFGQVQIRTSTIVAWLWVATLPL